MIVHRRRSEEKQFGYRRDGREASPYLVAHRRIIDVIRIMYPRTTGERGGRGERENRRGRCVLILACISKGGACTKGTATTPSRNVRSRQGRPYPSLFLFSQPSISPATYPRGVPPSPCIAYYSFFVFFFSARVRSECKCRRNDSRLFVKRKERKKRKRLWKNGTIYKFYQNRSIVVMSFAFYRMCFSRTLRTCHTNVYI